MSQRSTSSRTIPSPSSPRTAGPGTGQVTASGLPRLATERTLPSRRTEVSRTEGPLYQQRVVPELTQRGGPLTRVNIQDSVEGPTTHPVVSATGVILWVNPQDEFGIDAVYQIGSGYFDARDLSPRESVADNFESGSFDLEDVTSVPVLLQSDNDWGVYQTSTNSSGETTLNALVDINEVDDLKDVVVLAVPDLNQSYGGEGNYPENTTRPPFDPEWLSRLVNLSEQNLPLNDPRSIEEINAEVEISIGEEDLPPPPEPSVESELEEEVIFEQEQPGLVVEQRPGSFPTVERVGTGVTAIRTQPVSMESATREQPSLSDRVRGRPAPPGIPGRTMSGSSQMGTVGRINPTEDRPYTGVGGVRSYQRGTIGRIMSPSEMPSFPPPSIYIPPLMPASRVLVPVQQDPRYPLYEEDRRYPMGARSTYQPSRWVQQPVPRDLLAEHHDHIEPPENAIELRLWIQEGEIMAAYYNGRYYSADTLDMMDDDPDNFLQIFLRREEIPSNLVLIETPDFIGLYMTSGDQLRELIPIPVDSNISAVEVFMIPDFDAPGNGYRDFTIPSFIPGFFHILLSLAEDDDMLLNSPQLMTNLRSNPLNQIIYMSLDSLPNPPLTPQSDDEGMMTPPYDYSRIGEHLGQLTPTGMHYRSGSPRLGLENVQRGAPRVTPAAVLNPQMPLYEEVTVQRQTRLADIPSLTEVRRVPYNPSDNIQQPIETGLIEDEREVVERPEGTVELRLFVDGGQVLPLYYLDGEYYDSSFEEAPPGYFVQVFLRRDDLTSTPLLIETTNFVGIYTMANGELREIIPVPVDDHIVQVILVPFPSHLVGDEDLPSFDSALYSTLISSNQRSETLEDAPEFMLALRANPRNQIIFTESEPATPIQLPSLSQPRFGLQFGLQERGPIIPVMPVTRIRAVSPPPVRRVLFPSDEELTPSPFSGLPPYPLSPNVPPPERPTSPPLVQRSFEAYLQQIYGIPFELPARLPIPGLERLQGEFITFERASELLSNDRITGYTVDPLLQPWAGPPGGLNRIITLQANNGMTYLVKAQYDFESGQIFPPV